MSDVPKWIYQIYGGLPHDQAIDKVVSYGYPMEKLSGVEEYFVDVEDQVFPKEPVELCPRPKLGMVLQAAPMESNYVVANYNSPISALEIKEIIYKAVKMCYPCWVEKERINPKTSRGFWVRFYWWQWQLEGEHNQK